MRLFPTLSNFRIKFKLALTVLALSVVILLFLTELHFGAKAIRAFEVGEHFLNMTPLFT